jgi:hypothetical protein
VFRWKLAEGKPPFATGTRAEAENLPSKLAGLAFFAVVTNDWPTGLVPVFAVEKANRVELRRHPALGQENSTEPLFFALPPADEPDAARIAGRWECHAIRGGSKAFLTWELTVEGDRVAGRFDQNTDYRVANIAGGTFASNRLELRVEYIMDAYVVTGQWRDGQLKGEWRHTEDAEQGTWEATRQETKIPSEKDAVALYEWRRASDHARQYLLDGETLSADWERAARPLCRVWRRLRNGESH